MSNHLLKEHIYQLSAFPRLSNERMVCFAARTSGLFRSEDGGRTWASAFESLNLPAPPAALAVALSPDFEHDPSLFVGVPGAILYSSDGGWNWTSAQVPSPPPSIVALALSPNFIEDGLLFAGTLEDGVLCSSDHGRRWNAWNFGLLDLNTLCLSISPDFANDETIFVGTQSGIFRSTNGGRAWREVNLPIEFDSILSLALSPEFTHDRTVFAGTESHGLWCSKDRGQTWQRLGKSKLKQPMNSILIGPDFELLVLHGDRPMMSTDFGKTWQAWRAHSMTRKSVTSILCPNGLDPEAPALIGYADGTIELS